MNFHKDFAASSLFLLVYDTLHKANIGMHKPYVIQATSLIDANLSIQAPDSPVRCEEAYGTYTR